MGWGLPKPLREKVLGDLCTPRKKGKPLKKTKGSGGIVKAGAGAAALASGGRRLVVADLNALIRAKAVTLSSGPQLSLHKIVHNALMDMARALETPTHLVAVYDTVDAERQANASAEEGGAAAAAVPRSMPKMRDGLWSTRYAKPSAPIPKTEADAVMAHLKAAAASNVAAKTAPPATYAVLFTPGPLKRATWHAVGCITRRVAAALHAQGTIPKLTMVASDHSVFSTTDDDEGAASAFAKLADENLGEADLKIYRVAQLLPAEAVVLKTVDTDIILQTMATPDPPAAKSFRLALKDFDVDGAGLLTKFAATAAMRLEVAFWWIAAGSTDYCKAMSDQGYGKQQLLDLTHPKHELRHIAVFTEDAPAPHRFHFHPAAVLKKLQSLPKTRKVARNHAGQAKKSGRSLNFAVKQALLCAAYYSLMHTHPDPDTFAADLVLSPKAKPVKV